MTAEAAGVTNNNPFGNPADNSFNQLPNIISWDANTGNNTGSFSDVYAPPIINGVRFDHDGQWYPLSGPGLSVWGANAYNSDSNGNAGVPNRAFPGMRWHDNNSRIPISGFVSRLFIPDPRVGAAHDVHGNAKTVVRGGSGVHPWQFSEGDIDPALNPFVQRPEHHDWLDPIVRGSEGLCTEQQHVVRPAAGCEREQPEQRLQRQLP